MKVVISAALLLFSSVCLAQGKASDYGISVEPYAGYYKGDLKADSLQDGELKSFVAGARLGYNAKVGASFGIDYAQGDGDWTADNEAVQDKTDFNVKEIGVYLGYHLTSFLEITAAYFPEYKVEVDSSKMGVSFDELSGDGYNVGLNFRVLDLFRINANFQVRELKKTDDTSLSGSNKAETVFVSFSAPLNFPYKIGN